MDRGLLNAIAGTEPGSASGIFYRHAWIGTRDLKASDAGGRWGPPRVYRVLYLGRPEESVVVEAYRNLVDKVEGMRGDLVGPRRLFEAEVTVTNLLDLRVPTHCDAVGLSLSTFSGPWEPCQRVARAAHQLGMHGIVAPAATGLGLTLALFERHLPRDEWPHVLSEVEWARLPADPRRLRVVGQRYGGAPEQG